MQTTQRGFRDLLKLELEDLWEHAERLAQDSEARRRAGQVSAHVCYENVAVLKNEECCYRSFIRILDALDPGAFDGVRPMVAEIRRQFRERVEACGFCNCSYLFADRKIQKLLDGLHETASPGAVGDGAAAQQPEGRS